LNGRSCSGTVAVDVDGGEPDFAVLPIVIAVGGDLRDADFLIAVVEELLVLLVSNEDAVEDDSGEYARLEASGASAEVLSRRENSACAAGEGK
jgi:hypothetical protein